MVVVYKEILASHSCVIRKEKGILIAVSDHCEYSSLLLHPNWTSGNFLKVSYKVESKARF